MTAAQQELDPHATEVHYRIAAEVDLPFFFKSMLNSYFQSGIGLGPVFRGNFYRGHTKRIEACLARDGSKLVIACLPDDPSTILGFLLAERGIIHYAYVKLSFRRHGIAASMAKALGITELGTYTHLTEFAAPIIRGRGIYDPYLF